MMDQKQEITQIKYGVSSTMTPSVGSAVSQNWYLEELRFARILRNDSDTSAAATQLGKGQIVNFKDQDGKPKESGVELSPTAKRITELEEALEDSRKECKSLRNQVSELSTNLLDAQDLVFSLQSRVKNVTEVEAAAEYSGLCGDIEDWVQSRLIDVLDDRKVFHERRFVPKSAENFLRLVSTSGREAFEYKDTE